MRKIPGFITCLLLSFALFGAVDANAAENLLINGSGEDEMTGWTELQDGDSLWWPDTTTTNHNAIDGSTFFWPSKAHCEYACMYQDVDVSGYSKGTWMSLSAWLANYDQSPHDQATLKVQVLNSKGTVLYEDYSLQRNPEWCFHELNFSLPAKASTVRVLCIADRFVGSDNDAYFDDIVLTVSGSTISEVTITGNTAQAQPGDTIQLSASDGKYKKASYYEWSSSYDAIATVDENGLVTMVSDPDPTLVGAEVWIFAKNKKTGVIGKYYINSQRENSSGSTKTEAVTKPAKVKTLSAVSVKLKWTKSQNASGYYIYQYNKSTKKYKKIATIKKAATTTYTVNSLKMNKEYKFKIVAYKTGNGKTVTSDDSNIVTVSLK